MLEYYFSNGILSSSVRAESYRWKTEQLKSQCSKLEHQVMQLELVNRELQYSIQQAREEGRTSETIQRQLRDQLDRLETRLSGEVEGRQVAEMRMRELEVKMRSLKVSHQQSQEAEDRIKTQLQTESEGRILQGGLYQEQVCACASMHDLLALALLSGQRSS